MDVYKTRMSVRRGNIVQTLVHVSWKGQTDTLVVPLWKSVAEWSHAYVRSVQSDAALCYSVGWFADGVWHTLEPTALLGEVDLPPGTLLHLRSQPPPGAAVEPTLQPFGLAPSSSSTNLRCRLTLFQAAPIDVERSGLSIDRSWIERQLSPYKRRLWNVRSTLGLDTPLTYVSRQEHCRIAIDRATQRWVLHVKQRVWLNGSVYAAGHVVELSMHNSELRLGRRGVRIAIQLTVS